MNSRWMNTNVSTAAEMLEVTDKMILDMSNGEVLYPAPCDDDDPIQGSMTDPLIFGEMENDDALMGHIKLPYPVVNVQYLFGTKPILPRLLGMSRSDLESVVYCSSYVVTDPGKTKAAYRQIIAIDDAPVFQEKYAGVTLMTGAEAISFLLEKEHIQEKDCIILHMLPVVPVSLRYKKITRKDHTEIWTHYSIEYLYDRLVFGRNRLIKLIELKAPDPILLNEKRMLQEYVDTLINNGTRGLPLVNFFGIPCDSLQELYEVTSVMSEKAAPPVMPSFELENEQEIRKRMLIIQSPEQEDDADDEDDWETFTPDDDPAVIARKEILSLLRPFVDAVIRENFPQYIPDYHDAMCKFAEHSISNSLDTINLDEPIKAQLLDGVIKTIRIAMKKQGMYL